VCRRTVCNPEHSGLTALSSWLNPRSPTCRTGVDGLARTFASTWHLRFACYYTHKRDPWEGRSTDEQQSLDAGVGRSLRLRGPLRLRGGVELTLTSGGRNGRQGASTVGLTPCQGISPGGAGEKPARPFD
jgi:hypothetical protein